ncbi:MAG: hypothetical protein LBR07_08710 [Puniceicoccales bacterium]|jgi:cell division protein FtsZ|nr:hypothetical protein [Puniceicoccales bacterium]
MASTTSTSAGTAFLASAAPTAAAATVAPAARGLLLAGVGGAGAETLDGLAAFPDVGAVLVDTDARALERAGVPRKLLIGRDVTRGLGAVGEPVLGERAAQHDEARLSALFAEARVAVLVAGLGGGTGGGALPVLARLAAAAGVPVVAFLIYPFAWEGSRRGQQAKTQFLEFRRHCEVVVPVLNDALLRAVGGAGFALEAFALGKAWVGRALAALCAAHRRRPLAREDLQRLRAALAARDPRTYFPGVGEGENAFCAALAAALKGAPAATAVSPAALGSVVAPAPATASAPAAASAGKTAGKTASAASTPAVPAASGTVTIGGGDGGGVRVAAKALRQEEFDFFASTADAPEEKEHDVVDGQNVDKPAFERRGIVLDFS